MTDPTFARSERAAVADLLGRLGPDAPTLCEGWDSLDLAAHLVIRERRLDSGPGILIPALAGWSERVRQGAKRRGLPRLIEQIRSGPPRLSPFALLDSQVNAVEYFIHHEDLRRAQHGWEPRELSPDAEDLLWKRLTSAARLMLRRAPVGVVMRRPGGQEVTAKRAAETVTVTGAPAELLLFAFGRQGASRAEVEGDPAAAEKLRRASLGL